MLGGVDLSLWPSLQRTINCGRHPWHKWKLWKNVSTFCQLLIFFYSANYFVYILSLHFSMRLNMATKRWYCPTCLIMSDTIWHINQITNLAIWITANLGNNPDAEFCPSFDFEKSFRNLGILQHLKDLKQRGCSAYCVVLRVSKCVKGVQKCQMSQECRKFS